MWEFPREGLTESSRRQEEVFQAIIADLAFWGNLDAIRLTLLPSTEDEERNKANDQLTAVTSNVKTETSNSPPVESVSKFSYKGTPFASMKKATIPKIQSPPSPLLQPVWKSAVDATTGRTYYYDIISRRTQWEKVRISLTLPAYFLFKSNSHHSIYFLLPFITASTNSGNGTTEKAGTKR
jgi:WW domain